MVSEERINLSTQHGHSQCVLCGEKNPQSLKLSFQIGETGSVNARFKPNHRLQGYDGILHGGVISALLDAAMTHCLFHHGIRALTGDLHVRFLHPVPSDSTLEIRAEMESSRPPLYRVKAELFEAGLAMAWAKGKFLLQTPPVRRGVARV